jgi:hypothetical protein
MNKLGNGLSAPPEIHLAALISLLGHDATRDRVPDASYIISLIIVVIIIFIYHHYIVAKSTGRLVFRTNNQSSDQSIYRLRNPKIGISPNNGKSDEFSTGNSLDFVDGNCV